MSLLHVADERLELAAFSPEPGGDGVVVRLYNPTGETITSRVTTALPLSRYAPSDLRDTWDESAARPLGGAGFAACVPSYACRTWILRS